MIRIEMGHHVGEFEAHHSRDLEMGQASAHPMFNSPLCDTEESGKLGFVQQAIICTRRGRSRRRWFVVYMGQIVVFILHAVREQHNLPLSPWSAVYT